MINEFQENSFLFAPAPFFMIRTPLLPIDEFFRILNQSETGDDLLSCYFSDEMLREAIAIASPSLSLALQTIEEKSKKERNQILSSLLKYILRMSTRSTPFGLFSSVSQGHWGDKTTIYFDHKNVMKRARPDMEWLTTVIDKICCHPTSFDILLIQANPLLFRNGNRIHLNYVRLKEGDKKQKKISINATPLATAILSLTKQPLATGQLIHRLLEQMPFLEPEKVRGVVRQLLEQQILMFFLSPSLLTASPFQDLLAKLSDVQDKNKAPLCIPEIPQLNEIAAAISNYNCQEAGKGEGLLQDIQTAMGSLASSKHFLQVDSAYQSEHLILNRSIGDELRKTAEVLWRLSFNRNQQLKEYHSKFIEKYGVGRKVPLLELLSEDGLGIPDIYSDSPIEKFNFSDKEREWGKWLKREWCKCLHEGRTEICLTEKIIDKILGTCSKENAPLSFDLYCEIIAVSASHIDKGDFLLNVSNSTWHGGSTFGRFIDILGVNTKESLDRFYCQEESLEENAFFAESSYLPFPARYANVAIYPNLRKAAIDFECNALENPIPIQDIMVGLLEERFYLSLRGKNEELVAMTGNVLNPKYAPIPLRFIRDVSRSRYSSIENFSLRELDSSPFAPRIKFNRSILSPAQWRVDLDLIDASPKDGVEKIGEKFLKWAAHWRLPRYVFMTYGDNRILLDYQKKEHLQEITSILKKNEGVKLVEKIGQEKGEWISSAKGLHFSEFVVPFIKNKKFQPPSRPLNHSRQDNLPSVNRWKLPGSDWLFIKLYLPKDNEISFLLQHLSRFTKNLQERGTIEGWFFIRYTDPSSHIRVRFRSEKEKILTVLIPALHDWSLSLLQDKLIHDMNIGCYEREIERYGGEEVIELAENFFCADASSAMELMRLIAEEKFPLPDFAITALSLIDLLKGLGMDIQEMLNFLKYSVSDKNELKGFRQIKNDLLRMTAAILDGTDLDSDVEVLNRAFKMRKEPLSLYGEKILKQSKEGALTHSIPLIHNSLLHMHCNRLMGNQLNMEKKAWLYAYHALECSLNKQM